MTEETSKKLKINIEELLRVSELASWDMYTENADTIRSEFSKFELPANTNTDKEAVEEELISTEQLINRISPMIWTSYEEKRAVPGHASHWPVSQGEIEPIYAEEIQSSLKNAFPPPNYAFNAEKGFFVKQERELKNGSTVWTEAEINDSCEELPKRAGYLIYRDEDNYVKIATCAKAWEQAWAGVVDNYIFTIITIFVAVGGLIYLFATRSINFLTSNWWAIVGLWVSIYFFYNFISMSLGGQTFGKDRLDIRVAMSDGTKPTLWAAFIRTFYSSFLIYWLAMAVYLPLVLVIVLAIPLVAGYFVIPFEPYKRGLHDILAGTYVISTNKTFNFE